MKILGISCFYHDSAAALIVNGSIVAAAQEERFTRIKHDSQFPQISMNYCLSDSGIGLNDLDAVVFYDKPWLKFERILETYYALAPKGAASFHAGLPVWIKEKALLPRLIRKSIPKNVPLKFSNHHLSHAASAFYPSPFKSAAIMTLDGVGEWATATIAHGQDEKIQLLKEMNFPHSLGLLYSAFTQFCGFKVNSGEYKLMGLAPYGRKNHQKVESYKKIIKNSLCHIFEDGSIWLDQDYFAYTTGLEMINRKKWHALFGFEMRDTESQLTQDYCDLALAIQEVTEEIILKLAQTAQKITGEKELCLAGGVALNCVANGALMREKIFKDIWIQPAAGDAGGAVGAALAYYYAHPEIKRVVKQTDSMNGSYLGPKFLDSEILSLLKEHNLTFKSFSESQELCTEAAREISNGKVLGWFQGRMEFGPRALGGRSILADPRSEEMQKKLNLKIKYREGFRPFAPSVLAEDLKTYFEFGFVSPYMLLVDHVKKDLQFDWPSDYQDWSLEKRLYHIRSKLPAVTHLDFSARVQSVHKETNPLYHQLISEFKKITGYGMVVNTSFNVRGEPIVGSPLDAIKCFFQTEMDTLCIGSYLLRKENQSQTSIEYFKQLKTAYALD
jgi:carbamoyltransferase